MNNTKESLSNIATKLNYPLNKYGYPDPMADYDLAMTAKKDEIRKEYEEYRQAFVKLKLGALQTAVNNLKKQMETRTDEYFTNWAKTC